MPTCGPGATSHKAHWHSKQLGDFKMVWLLDYQDFRLGTVILHLYKALFSLSVLIQKMGVTRKGLKSSLKRVFGTPVEKR